MGLFNLYKSKTYNYRYIYYDPEKEEREKKQRERNPVNENGEREPILKKGVFREMANKNKNYRQEQIRKANMRLIIIIFSMLVVLWYLFS